MSTYQVTATVTDTATGAQGTGSASFAVTAPVAPPAAANVTVDFTRVLVPVDPLGAGITLSTYSGNGQASILRSAAWKQALADLAPAHCRIPLRWNKGNPGSSAGGAQTSGDADAYIRAVTSIGALPYVIYGGDSTDNGISAGDAATFVRHYNDNGGQNGGPVRYWIAGNEPDNGGGSAAYLAALPGVIAAMHGADPSVVISAPAAAYWDSGLIQQAARVPGVGTLSYHAYNGGDPAPGGFPDQSSYGSCIGAMRAMKSGLLYGCEEVNWHYAAGAPQFFGWQNACFIADAYGQVLSAGGHVSMYADSNGALGLLNDGNGAGQPGSFLTPLPAYHGVGAWTGMNGRFRRYGKNMVPVTSKLASTVLGAYACDNGKIVLVNKGTSAQSLVIAMTGKSSGTYSAWTTSQSAPTAAIAEQVSGAAYSGGVIEWTIPGGTVASLEVS